MTLHIMGYLGESIKLGSQSGFNSFRQAKQCWF